MKTITKIKESSKAVAGTALLVGATIAGGAAMVSAQDSGSSGDLGDYPSPFIDDDGNVASTLVMGADAKATDVVAATEIAGQLGNDAFSTSTESVDVAGSFGWSADGGTTLDTRNDNLYFGDNIDEVRETLTQDDLDFLAETTFQDDSGTSTDITTYLNVGEHPVTFGEAEEDEDPALHVDFGNAAEGSVDATTYVYNLQANFGDSLDFSDSDVAGEEIELFGKTYTIAQENENGQRGDLDADELLLYGAQEEVTVETGESTTVTINGEEHTLEVVSVNSGGDDGNAAIRVDGSLRSEDTDATFNIDGQQVRVDQIIKTGGSESSSGVVQFAIGSEELTLVDGEPIQDEDGDDIEGSHVEFNGDSDVTDIVASDDGVEISSIDVYVGAEDDDENYVTAGETFSHSMFEDVELQFGGLNPDAQEAGDNVGMVEVSTSGDDTVTLDMTGDSGDDASINYIYGADPEDGEPVTGDGLELADSDGHNFISVEGQSIAEDEYFAADAGDFAHMWEVTSIDRDTDSNSNTPSVGDEATIDLRDAVTGNTVEVELDAQPDDSTGDRSHVDYVGEEIIDGQAYHFVLDGDSTGTGLQVAWGDSSDFTGNDDDTDTGVTTGTTSVFTPLDTDSGASVAFTQTATLDSSSTGSDTDVVYELPSTESTDEATVHFDYDVDTNTINNVESSSGVTVGDDDNDGVLTAQVNGGETYTFDASGSSLTVSPSETDPAALVIEPEDDSDTENTYTITNGYDSGDEELTVGSPSTTATINGDTDDWVTMESDDDVSAGYDVFGAYSEYDSDGQGSFTLHLPDGQSTAGVAVTGQDGSLSASAGASGSVETMTPTGWPAQSVALDSDDYIGEVKNDRNLILVGGPAANSLTQELADANKTWSTSDYTEGEGLLQLVPEAFNENHDALVVAGYTGEDTREAGRFLSNYGQHEEALDGETQVTINTAEGSVVQ
ncbi:S-layer protein [Candidatus Nanosalina sp. VS9-1]|uniref:S-layer protein n=1 Tax=Candidatus Nanosalina sp. VS9-1 TaxID=3388566 RepID=UPI0039E09962